MEYSTLSTKVPGELKKSAKGYFFFRPGDIFASKQINFPTFILKQTEEAGLALGSFASIIKQQKDPRLLVHIFSRQEARLSSKIENTQTEITDAFIEEQTEIPFERHNDWAELHAYINGLNSGIDALQQLPVCNRLLKDTHKILMSQVRGMNNLPGQFRSSQNWIGGSRPDNAHFVPPAAELLDAAMSNLELFIQDTQPELPYLINAAIIHAQFETIHPFLDGNGRIGRMLISLYLLEKKVIDYPILYLSNYFEKYRPSYYMALSHYRESHDGMIKWVSFFLDAVTTSAKHCTIIAQSILSFQDKLYDDTIPQMGKHGERAAKLLNLLYQNPRVKAKDIQQKLGFNSQHTLFLLNKFEELKIIKEITGFKRNRTYQISKYLELIEAET